MRVVVPPFPVPAAWGQPGPGAGPVEAAPVGAAGAGSGPGSEAAPLAAAEAGGGVTPPGMSQSETSGKRPDLLFPDNSTASSFCQCYHLDRLTIVFPVLVREDVPLPLGMTYWLRADGSVERFAHRRAAVEGSFTSRVSLEVHPNPVVSGAFRATVAGVGRRGLAAVWFRLDGNPAKWFQRYNLTGSAEVYRVARAFALSVLAAAEVQVERVLWSFAYVNRVDCALNLDAGSAADAASLIRSLSSRATVAHRRASGFASSLLFPGRRSSLSIYHKGPEMRFHPPRDGGEVPAAILEFADRVVRFEVVLRSESLDELGCRSLFAWREDSPGLLWRCWWSMISRLRFPAMSRVDLSCLSPPARRLLASFLAGQDVFALASRATVYRHRLAVLRAGGPDLCLPAPPIGEVVCFRREIFLSPAVPPAGLGLEAWEPPSVIAA